MLPPRPTLALALAALVLGALVAGAVLWRGGPVERAVRGALGETAVVVVRVENVGTQDADAVVDISEVDGGRLQSVALEVPAGGHAERRFQGRLSGDYLAHARIDWSDAPRSGRGDRILPFASNECGYGEPIVLVFVVDTTRGVSFTPATQVRCGPA